VRLVLPRRVGLERVGDEVLGGLLVPGELPEEPPDEPPEVGLPLVAWSMVSFAPGTAPVTVRTVSSMGGGSGTGLVTVGGGTLTGGTLTEPVSGRFTPPTPIAPASAIVAQRIATVAKRVAAPCV
jgi:hypothetical protein